jgi:hypothetical protein
MKKSWNPSIWAGFVLVLVGIASYPTFFARFEVTRDVPWANLPIMAVGAILLTAGVVRAFRQPELYRGKISGSILAVLTVLLVGASLIGILYVSKQIPASRGAPQVGQIAPDFTLPDSQSNPVALANLLSGPFVAEESSAAGAASGETAGAVLIFYRGYW